MATAPWRWYAKALQRALTGGGVDFTSGLTITLHSGYTPNFDTDEFVSNLTGELATANGYAGPKTLTGVATNITPANSWAQTRANSTAYVAGEVRRPATGNGFVYQVVTGGTSGASIPSWPTTVGQTVTDGTVVWVCAGRAVIALDFDDPSWTGFSASYTVAVISDRTAGTAATQPLIGAAVWGSAETGGGGAHTIQLDPAGALLIFA